MPTPYKFNAKELDSETGLYYYGARYYTPELSIWLSVDPLSDKYPHQSNYMYCSGNPMNRIDPDGRDEWEVNRQTGEMKNVKKTDKDIIYQTYNGKRTGIKSDEFDNNSIGMNESPNRKDNGLPEYTDLKFKDTETGNAVFAFLADNTEVEWSKVNAIENLLSQEFVSVHTSHNEDREARSSHIVQSLDFINNNNLISHTHSHPYNRYRHRSNGHFSSSGDRDFKNRMLNHFPNARFYLRFGGGFLRDYTNDTRNYYGQ